MLKRQTAVGLLYFKPLSLCQTLPPISPIRVPAYMSLDFPLTQSSIAVVVPCFCVGTIVLDVLARMGPEVTHIIVVDDACPDGTADTIAATVTDPRVILIRHEHNKGVGGAVISGYRKALELGADIVVKVDGDGQMPPELIPHLVRPIIARAADYAKGNRFHSLFDVKAMPRGRLFGNGVLSFVTKISSGYWGIFDPTNGFTAIHREALGRLELNNLAERYFFETDMLVNLGNIRAVVRDVPTRAIYGNEVSGLRVSKNAWNFTAGHTREFLKRILYNYFMRDFSFASVQLLFGLLLTGFGVGFGALEWYWNASQGTPATTGTVMLAVLPIILGFQLLMGFLSYDIANEPKQCLQNLFQMTARTRFSGGEDAPDAATARRSVEKV